MFFNNYKPHLSLFTFLIVIFFLRMFLWIYADLDLGFDEAQYWTWIKNLYSNKITTISLNLKLIWKDLYIETLI